MKMGFVQPLAVTLPRVSQFVGFEGIRTSRTAQRTLKQQRRPQSHAICACAESAIATVNPSTSPKREIDSSRETLSLLEWSAFSSRVASFASTAYGRRNILGNDGMLQVPVVRADSEQLLGLTREAHFLENALAKPLPLGGVHDVLEEVRLTAKGVALQGSQLVRIAETLDAARKLRKHIEAAVSSSKADAIDDGDERIGDKVDGSVNKLARFRQMVATLKTWPDVEAQIRASLDDFGEVLDSCDPALYDLRSSIKEVVATIRSRLHSLMAAHANAIQDRVITTRFDRFVIPVKVSQKAEFRKGVVHDVSASGATVFIEPQAVRALNDKLRELCARERARITAILRKLSVEVVSPIADDFDHLCSVIGILDAACARANASISLNGKDVHFTDGNSTLSLYGVRHPLLSWKVADDEKYSASLNGKAQNSKGGEYEQIESMVKPHSNQWKTVVPNDFIVPDGIRCVCVTGPNTGGKTISLKTLGMAVLMAKAGLFVPADMSRSFFANSYQSAKSASSALQAENMKEGTHNDLSHFTDALRRVETPDAFGSELVTMPYFDYVLADIGDDQSLVQSLSTFSGHIERIKRILKKATPNSLVLFDEIGSGTDPAEGAALGMALLRYLAGADGNGRKAGLTFATTHHGELKTLKYNETAGGASLFENASVEFDRERMAPTFKLLWGVPGRSNALAIASRLGLQTDVVDAAEKILSGELGDGRMDVSKMIGDLEQEKKAAETARVETQQAWKEVAALRDELRVRLEKLQASEQTLRNEKRALLNMELEDARKQIGGVIKEMQQAGLSARHASEASKSISEIGKEIASSFVCSEDLQNMSDEDGRKTVADKIQVGSRVLVPRLGDTPVEVTELDRDKQEISVLVGALRVKVTFQEVSKVVRVRAESAPRAAVTAQAIARKQSKRELKASRRHGSAAKTTVRTSANTVDVRGQRVDEAEANVEQAISRSLMVGCLWIIHGHGTGRLKSGLLAYLKSHESVDR